ncbi:predicted protein [Nematostella vectensis]|uniref:Uncharacterized protein n=1 Tax=Nematostella vectensis TaxID=45351 RepID=A7S6L8_NEMVE|nr:predicted protein [Nematostella vectensis]|eukprot:XP_001632741.1 predicted protein [Nematostella vectensis]
MITAAGTAAVQGLRESSTRVSPTTIPTSESDLTEVEVSSIMGRKSQLSASTQDKPDTEFCSVGIDLTCRVSDRIKAKIWANEYVNLNQLLVVSPEETKLRLSIDTEGENPGLLCLDPVHSKKKASSLHEWVTAFNIYIAVFVSKEPTAASGLLKYSEVVRDIASRGGNWRFYDEQFRLIRQSQPNTHGWNTINWELWNQACHTISVPRSNPTDNKVANRRQYQNRPFSSMPKVYCFRFHTGQFCDGGCRFKRAFFRCGASHSANLCSKSAPKVSPSSGMDGEGPFLPAGAHVGKSGAPRALSAGVRPQPL